MVNSTLPSQSESNTIDSDCIDAIRALQRPGKPDIMTKVINLYFEDAFRQIEAMRSGYYAGDAEVIKEASHRLKSGSANIGALWVAEHCKEVEDICREGLLLDDVSLISGIEEGYFEARDQLEVFCESEAA